MNECRSVNVTNILYAVVFDIFSVVDVFVGVDIFIVVDDIIGIDCLLV